MNQWNSIQLAAIPTTWLAALLAGLPHLLYALVKALPIMLQNDGWSAPRFIVDAWQWAFTLFVLAMVFIAWRGSWPRWAATILGYVLVVILEMSLTIWREDRLIGFSAMIVLIGYVCLIVWLARRDPLAGLLCVVPFYPMFVWWTGMDRGQGDFGGLYWIFVGLGMAVAVSLVIRRGSLPFGLGALAVAVLGLGMGYSFVYSGNIPVLPPLTPGAVLLSGLRELLAFVIVCLPLWLTLAWGWERRRSAVQISGSSE